MTTTRSTPITHRDKTACQVTAAVTRQLFDALEFECRKIGMSKSEFIRNALQEALNFYPGELGE